jgi:hypothetical protein
VSTQSAQSAQGYQLEHQRVRTVAPERRRLGLSQLERAEARVGGADGLRVILAGAHSLCAMLGDQPAPSLAWLRAQTDRACGLADPPPAALADLASRLAAS